MATKLIRGDKVNCPLCGKPHEKVEDYVVMGHIGADSEQEDACGDCGAYFTVIRSAANQYEVLAI